MSENNSTQRVIDGTAWDEFCDGLKEAGRIVQSEKAPQDAFNQAEGYRYMTRMLRAGLESFLEFSDSDYPELRCPVHDTIKMGADNPDNLYQNAKINPQHDYKIVGTRGTVDYLGFGAVANRYASGGTMETTGFLDSREMDINPDGSFEIILSQNKQPGNWLPMTEDTNSLNVRQTFQDRKNEEAADVKLMRIGAEDERPEPFSAEKLDRGLQGVVQFLKGTTGLFEGWAESFLPHHNELPGADQAYCQLIGGDPNIYYFHSTWSLEDDEVMILEADVPECQTWNFVLQNWWLESLDFRYHNIHFNKHSAKYNDDGSVRIVVSHTNPGCDNWVETAGHNNGSMCWRWIGASEHPPVKVSIKKLSEL